MLFFEKGVRLMTYEVNNMFDLTYQHPNDHRILTRCRAYFDKKNDILHILDKNFPEDRSVIDSLSTDFIEWVLDEIRVRYIPNKIYCYGCDGEVVEYGFKKDFKFKTVNEEELKKWFE
jgi:hypothetical protein